MNQQTSLRVGDRIVVANLIAYVAIIDDIIDLREQEARIKYVLKWPNGNRSHVYDHDENVIWYAYKTVS